MMRPVRTRIARMGCIVSAVVIAASVCVGCGPVVPSRLPGGRLRVVAAENSWGSIAKQLAGTRADVTSIIKNPNTDPHDYEPTVADVRAIAKADVVIYNGIGYDPWVERSLAANPNDRQVALNVGEVVGVPAGANPHQWYSPSSVRKVVDRVTETYKRLDPGSEAYFERQRTAFQTKGLARYDALIAAIRAKYAGVPMGASESSFAPMAEALGLKMLTPPTFLASVSEGTEPTARDKAEVDAQIRSKRIKVFVYNRQNATPDVNALVSAARARGIPVVTITETLEPASATFQDWQADQLAALEQALAQATGR